MHNAVSSFDFPAGSPRVSRRVSFWSLERFAAGGFAVLTAGLILVKPGLVHYEFPLVSLLTGAFLYRRKPAAYVSFTLWLYFLSPLIRRIVDFRSSWMDPSPILLAPLLTTCITAWFLLTNLNRSWFRRSSWPYGLALLAIAAGVLCGVAVNPSKKDVFAACLNWVAPICFGYYMAAFPFDRQEVKKAITQTFIAGILVMGLYGLYQFAQAPAWDCNWLDMLTGGDISVSALGRPEPFGLRIWSTMNSPGPFTTALTVGLLLVFVETRKIRIPAAVAGAASFLLSLVRSGWLGWVTGLFAILASNKKYLRRVLVSVGLCFLFLLPLLFYEPVADAVQARLGTFQSMGSDESANERMNGYSNLAEDIVKSPFGYGLTNKDKLDGYVVDSTLLRLPLQLGWAGCLFYVAAIAQLLRSMFPLSKELNFAIVARAIVLSVLVRAPLGQVLTSFDGLILWMFCGLAIAEAKRFVPKAVI